ncbi:uncharacterized protein B0H18DRAFT_971309 [Fomitopsis serialis]|uniref:uncharacterized protein n=1 Tax=Fomitopsis serialis TaxID=139415 RepID=UPI00200859F0|nr:uncharacterized protein B0H18DRAFT_971309 [Neoantrodia serialis]KAH9937581.1 hypothetical protein B0H18DRAFT_971309 [Neoantrodia serialis]
MPIFQDSTGLATKFFIQKDIPHEIQADVCETIATLGGRVEAKVPRAGYILIQPGTAEEERLRLCWASPDRPDRYFVPYTFVEACKIHGILLKQIFIHDGQPIRMHIDSSIANVNVRATLSARIMHSGGDPTASAQSARVILADPNTDIFHHLVKTYQGESDKYVESYLWVKRCIEKGQVIYTPVIYKNPGGRRPGEERTQFSDDDEEHLCDWIAAKIPYKKTGGRTGNRLYQQLCEMASDPEYAWVTRHTWQSWRERYKKNAARLDAKISEIVEQKKPAHGAKGQYGYVRAPEEKPRRIRIKKGSPSSFNAGGSGAAGPSSVSSDMQELENFPPVPMPVVPGVLAAVPHGPGQGYNAHMNMNMNMHMNGMHGMPGMMYPGGPPPGPPPMGMQGNPPMAALTPETARQHATEEEMEDDESEWQIRVGDANAPQPAWAKRKQEAEGSDHGGSKRQRTSGSPPQQLEPGPAPPDALAQQAGSAAPAEQAQDIPEGARVDSPCVDPSLSVNDIAHEFRFTLEEVEEYYAKYQDIARTRARFRKMRDVLAALEDDD